MKPSKSNTLRGAVLALAASVVALILGVLVMTGVLDAAGAALVTGFVAPVLGGLGAIWAAYGRYNPSIKPLKRKDSLPGPWTIVLAVLSVWMALPACGSTFLCQESYVRNLQPAKPFTDNAVCDGDEVFRASGPIGARFRVSCPDGKRPAFDADGVVGCQEAGP